MTYTINKDPSSRPRLPNNQWYDKPGLNLIRRPKSYSPEQHFSFDPYSPVNKLTPQHLGEQQKNFSFSPRQLKQMRNRLHNYRPDYYKQESFELHEDSTNKTITKLIVFLNHRIENIRFNHPTLKGSGVSEFQVDVRRKQLIKTNRQSSGSSNDPNASPRVKFFK